MDEPHHRAARDAREPHHEVTRAPVQKAIEVAGRATDVLGVAMDRMNLANAAGDEDTQHRGFLVSLEHLNKALEHVRDARALLEARLNEMGFTA